MDSHEGEAGVGDPFDSGWVWSRTDDAVIAVTSPRCVGYLRAELRRLSRITTRRMAEHGNYPLPANRSPLLRVVVHARATQRYGPQVDSRAPDVESEALQAMVWQHELLVEVLPVSGGVIELPSYDHEGALLALLCDLREAMPVDIDRVLLHHADHPHAEEYVEACQTIARGLGAAVHAWHTNNQTETVPARVAQQLTA